MGYENGIWGWIWRGYRIWVWDMGMDMGPGVDMGCGAGMGYGYGVWCGYGT